MRIIIFQSNMLTVDIAYIFVKPRRFCVFVSLSDLTGWLTNTCEPFVYLDVSLITTIKVASSLWMSPTCEASIFFPPEANSTLKRYPTRPSFDKINKKKSNHPSQPRKNLKIGCKSGQSLSIAD